MEYLADNGFRLTITSLKCGHSLLTSAGSVSEHSTGDAMDIAAVNGIPIMGNQGKGTVTAAVIESLLRLQGTMAPHQIISLMDFPGTQSFPLPDHYDHIHVGYYPTGNATSSGAQSKQFDELLKPDQWRKLIGRIERIQNPHVPTSPSRYAIPAGKRPKQPSRGD
jgi:hypothetical protein